MIEIVEKKSHEELLSKLQDFLDDKISIYNFIRAKDIDKVFLANYSYDEYKQNIKKTSLESLRCMYRNNVTITKKYSYVDKAFDLENECANHFKNSFSVNDFNFVVDVFIVKFDLMQIDENEKIVRFIECKNKNSIKHVIIQNFHTILLTLLLIERLNIEYDFSFRYVIFYNKKVKEFDSVFSFINYTYTIMKDEYEKVLEHVRRNSVSEISYRIFSSFFRDLYANKYKHENVYLKYKNELLDRVRKYFDDIYKSSIVLLRQNYDDAYCYKYVDVQSVDEMRNLNFNCYASVNNKHYIKYADKLDISEAFADKFIKNVIKLY